MKWLELKQAVIGSGAIYLFGCEAGEQAWQLKRRLKEQRPNAVILYAGPFSKIREYQATHWVISYRDGYHNYLIEGFRQQPLHSALLSLDSALQQFEQKHGFRPDEVVLVRAF